MIWLRSALMCYYRGTIAGGVVSVGYRGCCSAGQEIARGRDPPLVVINVGHRQIDTSTTLTAPLPQAAGPSITQPDSMVHLQIRAIPRHRAECGKNTSCDFRKTSVHLPVTEHS